MLLGGEASSERIILPSQPFFVFNFLFDFIRCFPLFCFEFLVFQVVLIKLEIGFQKNTSSCFNLVGVPWDFLIHAVDFVVLVSCVS